jgi:hypothetical protein
MKIISIVFCVLLIVTATLPALGTISSPTKSTIDRKELKVYANRMDYSQKEEMSITVENTGAETVLFNVFPKVEIFDEQGVKVFPTYMEEGEWFLRPGEKETYVWDQKDRDGQLVDEGKVTIQTVSELVVEPIFEPFIFDIGYVILVAGDDFVHDHRCFDGPREIYDDLIDMGFTDSKIQFLNDVNYGSDPKVDDIASAETVEEAITVWAASRVSLYSPLYIIMFDHGWINSFSVENDVGGDNVYASDLRSWIDTLYDGTSARIDVWIMACRSGSFIDDLSRDGYITITSTCESLVISGQRSNVVIHGERHSIMLVIMHMKLLPRTFRFWMIMVMVLVMVYMTAVVFMRDIYLIVVMGVLLCIFIWVTIRKDVFFS